MGWLDASVHEPPAFNDAWAAVLLDDVHFTGTVRTLTLNVKVKFIPNAKESENAPDYRIVAGNFEIGAAWKKVSKAERPYLSATLDDPSFPATIYARLVEGEDGAHNLIWSRSKGD